METESVEAGLQTAELQVLFGTTTFGVLEVDESGRLRRANRRAAELLGYTQRELTDRPSASLFPGALLPSALDTPARECVLLRRDGSRLRASVEIRPLQNGSLWIVADLSREQAIRQTLLQTLQELNAVLDTAVVGIALLRHRQIERCNRRLEELFGYPPGGMLGNSTRLWYPSEESFRGIGQDVYAELGAGRECFREVEFMRRDGSRFWGRLAGRALDLDDPFAGSVWILEDLSEEYEARKALFLAHKVFEASSEAILITDAGNRIILVNAAFQAITGYGTEEVLGRDPKFMASGRHDKAFFRKLWGALRRHGHWEGEIWDKRKDGSHYPKWLTIDTIRDEQGTVTHHVAVFSDITERKSSEERIAFLAHHDPLTGLPNRHTLALHLEHAIEQGKREGTQLALMFLDLDKFKRINDSLGHHIGDLLLCEVARRIRGAVREADIVARIGGDEFVLILERCSLPADAAVVAQKVIDRLSDPFHFETHELHATPSIGIAIYPDDGSDIEALMRNADTAMYHAKNLGRNNYQFFDRAMNVATAERHRLESRLRLAMAGGEGFSLHYQPQVELASGRLLGVEALLRWHDAELGDVPPSQVIPLAEEIGLIRHIGSWVLQTACRQARAWLDAGLDMGRISVNVSAQQFRHGKFPALVQTILEQTGLPPERLELEITESILMESADASVAILKELKAIGVGLAVDDFGTGYSSLAYLKRFPIDCLKIDRSFVQDIENDPTDAAISTTVIALARALGVSVIAEGVETAGQRDFLAGRACTAAQGYFFSRPVPADKAAEFARRR